ncbi:Mitochondrial-processing peptidase subunit alpha [Ceratocystis fimbriata CBS 114723]|uniref:Mitochondrial-processing peptidase subunit alpha n=1 Tax=Ceratocystis fimbriata CBS 114723 TaxID=1035309 RepID=A0A2C5WU85_9PEZI|nr:Mitochondrial-processing peptidase subunit alpha [Ceratocystis fimbriata CBS 114723]
MLRSSLHSGLRPSTVSRLGFGLAKSSSVSALHRGLATPSSSSAPPPSSITKLPNGLRVTSEPVPGPFSGIGVYIDAGSRYEMPALRGVSHIMDRLAFKSTATRSADEMLAQVETLGGNIHCASSREAMMYQAMTFNNAVDDATALLAETVRAPKITAQEVSEQLETARYELQEIWAKPEMILPELVHTAAFKDNTLGNPLLCPRERLDDITPATIREYRRRFYTPDRVVLAFAGVEHDEALRLAEKHFGSMDAKDVEAEAVAAFQQEAQAAEASPPNILSKVPFLKTLSGSSGLPTPPPSPDLLKAEPPAPKHAHYTGGFLSLPPQPPNPNPNMPTYTHIHLAFEGLPVSSPDIYALATLQFLLGGGGSFSAGGPGKGMYSRLYTHVLNQHAWVESCVAFNHTYTDTGLFGISASCVPNRTLHMLQVMCRELRGLTSATGYSALTAPEVNRAKNQLRSSLLMNLESRMVELEDLGRQVQIHGRKIPVAEMCAAIDRLTVDDLRRVAATVFSGTVQNSGTSSGAPTVVLQEAGEFRFGGGKAPTWDQIQDEIARWQLGRR